MIRQSLTLLIFFAVLISARAQSWQPVQYANGTSPLARHENGFVEVNGKFYLIGGRGIKSVNIFDPVTRIWTAGAAPPIELHHFQPVVYQNRIYAICALTGGYPDETPVDRIYIYDPALNTWTQGATIPAGRRRGSAGLALFNNKFYIISGIQDGHRGGWVPWTDEYDPVTGIWTALPDAPQARDHFHVGLINGKIYCAGGRRTSQPIAAANTISSVDVFDIATRTWSTPTQLPTPSGAPAVAVVNNELVVGGGEVEYQSNALSTVQSYNPVTNIWTTRPNLDVGRHATQFVYHSGTLYIAAGSTTQGGGGENNTMASAPFGSPPANTPPVVVQAPAAQSVPNTQATVVLQLGQIFNDDGGVNNLTFTVPNNTNPALLSNTQIVGTQITFTLSGTTGSGTITLRATDVSNAFVQTTFQLTVTSGGTPTLTNVIRINAGGPAQNFGGEAWVADQNFTGGTPYSTTNPISNTSQDQIYQSERYGNFSYAIPVGQAGMYAVDLHLAEIYFATTGQRVFNINIENGQFVRTNLDLIQTFGPNNTANVLRADNLNITDGTINITFTNVVNNAKVSGIAVGRYSTPPANTPPVVVQAPAPQSVPNTQATVVLQLGTIFNDDGGVNNLTFTVPNNTNTALLSNTQITGTQLTFTLSGTTGSGVITLRATDASNAFVETTFQLTVTPPAANTPPVVVQAPAAQSVPNTQATVVLQLGTIFNDDAGVNNLIFTVTNNTNSALLSNTQIVGTQITFTLSGTTGSGTITLRATDASNAFVETTFSLTVTSGGTPTLTNVIRINSGGPAQNFGGETWVADQNFTSGTPYSTTSAISNTTQDQIYQTERFGNFSYAIPVGQAGTYAVDLHLAEIYFTTTGQRVFNINIENGQFVRTNLDLIQTFGPNNTANVLRADNLNITDGTINITFTNVVNNAKVSGIAVGRYSTPPANTPPVVVQAPAPQSVPNTQASVVLQLGTIFNDDGGVNNLTFTVPNNTNAALLSNTQISGTQLTFTLSGTTGSGMITLRATDVSNAFVETTFSLTVTSGGTPTLTNVIRINSGGPAQNFGGEAWVADQNFTGGTPYSTTSAISNTTQDQIYQSERYGNFSYAIPVGQAGTYAVDLHLAEIYFAATGQRVFNINIENGQFVRTNLDLIQTFGPNNTANVLRADNLNITDGTINITFTNVVNNAKISGIAVGRYSSGSGARMATENDHESIVTEPKDVMIREVQAWTYQVYPNPTQNDEFYVKLDVKQRERWNFTLMDFAGRQISLGAFELDQGAQEITFDIRSYNLSAGIYYFEVQNGQTRKNIKLAIK